MNTNIKNKILLIDLTATIPVYTAYINDALRRNGYESVISGINRTNGNISNSGLIISYTNIIDRSQYLRNGPLKNILKLLEYVCNWIHTLWIAPSYHAIHIQWLPMLRYGSMDLFFLKRLLSRNSNVIYEVHNILPHDHSSLKIQHRYGRLYNMVPKLIVHTVKTKQDLKARFDIPISKMILMPHGPLFDEWADDKPIADRNKKTLGMIGVIRPYKGVDDAIELLRKLLNKDEKFSLIIAGDGPAGYLKHLDELITSYKLENNVKRIYRLLKEEEMIRLYKQCRLILAPYKDIEQSGAVITALTLGIPVAGYKVGGLPMLIEDDFNGKLVPKNDIDKLCDAVTYLLKKDPEMIHKNCRKSVEKYSWDKGVPILKACYDEDASIS
ncbi:MAG TPA: glycosyltransferase family 4 protein [Balneolales bacterium]|nr:glycosyltransferase family 4 protein [Balneolales bacterium]